MNSYLSIYWHVNELLKTQHVSQTWSDIDGCTLYDWPHQRFALKRDKVESRIVIKSVLLIYPSYVTSCNWILSGQKN